MGNVLKGKRDRYQRGEALRIDPQTGWLQLISQGGRYHLVDGRALKVRKSAPTPFVPARQPSTSVAPCTPSLDDGRGISFEGGTFQKKLVLNGADTTSITSEQTFLQPRIAVTDPQRCQVAQHGSPPNVLVLHRTSTKGGDTRLTAVSSATGKSLWTATIEGAPDGLMGGWIADNDACPGRLGRGGIIR